MTLDGCGQPIWRGTAEIGSRIELNAMTGAGGR